MSKQQISPMDVIPALSDKEMDELDSFLTSEATSDETMMLDCLDGYLTAFVSGPVMLKPSEWLPRVWGPTADDAPTFETNAQAERIIGLMMRHLNGIIWNLQQDPDHFAPVFDFQVLNGEEHEYIDGEMWAHGYMTAIEMHRDTWKSLYESKHGVEVLRPIHLLGATDVTQEEDELTRTPAQREALSKQIQASIGWIYTFWAPYRHAVAERTIAKLFEHESPRQGRNETCNCGSGKKFKKCCGASTVLH